MPRGRKAKTPLWQPRQVDVLGPFVNQLGSSGSNTPISIVISYFSNLQFYQPTQDKDRLILYQFMRWCMADVSQRKWGVDLQLSLGGKPLDRRMATLVRKEGAILTKLLNLVAEVHLVKQHGYPYAALWWATCIMEGECTFTRQYKTTFEAPSTKDGYVSQFQGITAALANKRNPFKKKHTKLLFDDAIELSNKSTRRKEDEDRFYSSIYMPYLTARSDMTKFLREKGTEIMVIKHDYSK